MEQFFNTQDVADKYIRSRPTTPDDIIEKIIEYFSERNDCYEHAVDVGCGSGQNTLKLAQYFKKVTGIDISEVQIKQAPKHQPNVNFRLGEAENLEFCPDASIDLITVASALHWFPNREKFYKEVKRVLKRNGVLAVLSYYFPNHDDYHSTELFTTWLRGNIIAPGYTSKSFHHLMNKYAEISLPFKEPKRLDIEICTSWSVDRFVDFIGSTSVVECLYRHQPSSTAITDLKDSLKEIYTRQEKEELMKLTWPYFLLLGRN